MVSPGLLLAHRVFFCDIYGTLVSAYMHQNRQVIINGRLTFTEKKSGLTFLTDRYANNIYNKVSLSQCSSAKQTIYPIIPFMPLFCRNTTKIVMDM